MRYRPRRRTGYHRRKRPSNVLPAFLVLMLIAGVAWLGYRFVTALFSNVHSETVAAELQISRGSVDFSFAENDSWVPAYTEQKFIAGDSVRTGVNTRASLEVFGGNMIFLDDSTHLTIEELEQKSSGKKIVLLSLHAGRIWSRVSPDDFNPEDKSRFELQTERAMISAPGAVLDLSSSPQQDTLRLIRGQATADITKKNEPKETTTVEVGVGQKLVVNSTTYQRAADGMNVLEGIDPSFSESEWHLQNLELFFPQEASTIRRRIELSAPKPEIIEETNTSENAEVSSPEVLEPENGITIPAVQDSVKIEGTAPANATQIQINGYTLTRYNAGDRKWTYFAAKKFGTLLAGENTFEIVALTRDGKKSAPTKLTIYYEGESYVPAVSEEVEEVGSIEASDFKAPVVTRPASLTPDIPYQTSSQVVTISGIVDPKTNRVVVNDFKLQKFAPGQTEFSYIANAQYGNMKEGENVYEIKAFGPDDGVATTTVKVFYTPVELGE